MTETGEPIIDQPSCIGCLKCVKICPAQAIEMVFTPEEEKILAELAGQSEAPAEIDEEAAALAKKLAAYKGVWVFVEQTEGEAAKVSWELLGKGRELAATLNVELSRRPPWRPGRKPLQRSLRLRRRPDLPRRRPGPAALPHRKLL